MANTTEQTGASAAIRKVLKQAGVELTVADIAEALPAGIEVSNNSISAICRQRAKAGEFTSDVVEGKCVYGLVAGWVRSRSTSVETTLVVPELLPVAVAAAEPEADAIAAAEPAAAEPSDGDAASQVAPAAPATLDPSRAALGLLNRVERLDFAPTARVKAPLALCERLGAVVTDIEDAIGDACDAELPHAVIKALVLASGATQRALQQLAA